MFSGDDRPAEREREGKLDDLISLCYFVVKVCSRLLFVWLWLALLSRTTREQSAISRGRVDLYLKRSGCLKAKMGVRWLSSFVSYITRFVLDFFFVMARNGYTISWSAACFSVGGSFISYFFTAIASSAPLSYYL